MGTELCITTENIKGCILVVLYWRKGTVWMFFLPTAIARCHKSLIFLLQVCGIWPWSSFQTCVCFWSVCNACWLLPICISWQKYVHRREKHKHVIHNSFLYFSNWGLETFALGVDRYVFFRADTDTDYYRSSRPITDILNRYTCLV